MTRPVYAVICVPRLLAMMLLSLGMTVFAQTFTAPGFTAETVVTLPPFTPVGQTFAPDGRMFIWQKEGQVRIFKNGALLPTPFLDFSARVNRSGDRGLMGLALDPSFASNGFVYLYYVFENGGDSNSNAPRTARITRVKADPGNPDVMQANSETVIVGKLGTVPCQPGTDCISADFTSHVNGTVRFGPDGKLYFGMGDGGSFAFADPLSLRAQDINMFNGKIARVNPDGTAPSDNPFYDGNPNATRSKIYAYGLRNPFRFSIHPQTGQLMYADVGQTTWEEINRGRGLNFGWPCFEGNDPNPKFQSAFPQQCAAVPASAVTKPLYLYPTSPGGAVIGGPFYTGTQFPVTYRGNFFFADYVQNFIRRMVFAADGSVASVEVFATDVSSPVSLEQGPDGALYYVSITTGEVRRIRFNSNGAPVAVATAKLASPATPYSITFSSNGSSDPDGKPLTYKWDFGDGQTATTANPTHSYPNTGVKTYTATLTVTDAQGLTATDTVPAVVGSRPPVATITSPGDGARFTAGATVTFTGTGTDPDETLPASALSWQVLLHHNDHVHPGATATGTAGSFVVENHGTEGTFFYEIILKVTDSSGLSVTKSIRINPVVPAPPPPPPPPPPVLLPTPWLSKDVGNVGKAGNGRFASGTFTLQGSGASIGGTSDGLQYVYQSLNGDGQIIARVVSVQNTAADAKAGIMIRENLAANARHIMVRYRQDNHTATLYRSSTGGNTSISDVDSQQFQRWVKLVRTGNRFTSYQSPDGVTWKLIDTITINMPTDALFGLAVTANNNTALCTATFDNVGVTKLVIDPPLTNIGTGNGVKGEYFKKETFSDLKLTRTDRTIDFDWGTEKPVAGLDKDHFSIRWTGFVQPRSTGTYTFYVTASDTVRLWVNNQLLINASNKNATESRGTITLTAGQKYAIRLEFVEKDKEAAVRLEWSSPAQARQIVPQTQLYSTGSNSFFRFGN